MADDERVAQSFADGFAAALASHGMTLKELAARLKSLGDPVAHSTLSYWRSGGRYPSRASIPAVESIERILGAEPGELVGLVTDGDRPPTVPPVAHEESFGTDRFDVAAGELAERLGQPHDLLTAMVSTSKMRVSEDQQRATYSVSRVERAAGGRDVHHVVVFVAVPGGTDDPPRIVDTEGIRLANSAAHRDGELFGFRFEFDEPVRRGELVHFSTTMDAPLVEMMFGEAFSRRVHDVTLVLEFHPDSVPEWVEEFEEDDGNAATKIHAFDGRRSIVVSRRNFGPGFVALRWGSD